VGTFRMTPGIRTVARPRAPVVAVLVAGILAATTLGHAHAQSCGDADRDGSAGTLADAVRVLQAAEGVLGPNRDCFARLCDVDGSRGVTVPDGRRLLRRLVGLPDPLVCPSRTITEILEEARDAGGTQGSLGAGFGSTIPGQTVDPQGCNAPGGACNSESDLSIAPLRFGPTRLAYAVLPAGEPRVSLHIPLGAGGTPAMLVIQAPPRAGSFLVPLDTTSGEADLDLLFAQFVAGFPDCLVIPLQYSTMDASGGVSEPTEVVYTRCDSNPLAPPNCLPCP
jgi:hypothetical protein